MSINLSLSLPFSARAVANEEHVSKLSCGLDRKNRHASSLTPESLWSRFFATGSIAYRQRCRLEGTKGFTTNDAAGETLFSEQLPKSKDSGQRINRRFVMLVELNHSIYSNNVLRLDFRWYSQRPSRSTVSTFGADQCIDDILSCGSLSLHREASSPR